MEGRRRRSEARRSSRGDPPPGHPAPHHQVQERPGRRRPAMAHARTDGGQEAALSVQPGPGDRESQLDPDAGFTGHPPDVGSDHPRSRGPHRRDERAQVRRANHPGRRERFQLQDAAQRGTIHDRDGRRRPRVQAARSAHRRLDRAGHARPRSGRARRHGKNGRGGREALWPLSLGTVRPPRPSAVIPVRRNGKSDADLSDAHFHRRRQEPRRARRA